MIDLHELAKVIADNLPTPYAMDIVWKQVPGGAKFNLAQADEDSGTQWVEMAAAALVYILKSTNSKITEDGSIVPNIINVKGSESAKKLFADVEDLLVDLVGTFNDAHSSGETHIHSAIGSCFEIRVLACAEALQSLY